MSIDLDADSVGAADIAVRFFHLEKLAVARRLQLPPESFETIGARIAGVTLEEFRALRESLVHLRHRTARNLLQSEGISDALAALPFQQGDVIVALGDSITDDLVSWAYLLEDVLAERRPELQLRVMNAGYTGDTTQEAISRFDTVAAMRPDWIIQMLGTNDARRHGVARVRTTSAEENARNFAILSELVRTETEARHIILTPPPVIGRLADDWEPFGVESITWHDADVAGMAQTLRESSPSPVIDIHGALIDLPPDRWLLPDGVHPSAAGQSLIAREIIRALAAMDEPA